MNAPALRPLGIGETLDVAIKITTRNFAPLAKIVAFIVGPLSLVQVLVTSSAPASPFLIRNPDGTVTFETEDVWTPLAGIGVGLIVAMLASLLATAACFLVIADAYLGRPVDWRASVSYAGHRLHSVIWVSILAGLVTVGGLVLCVIPGIWLAILFTVAVPALLTEDLRGRKALGRSKALVTGRWWPTLAIVVLSTIFAGIVSGGFEAVAGAADPETTGGIIASWIAKTVASILTTPFSAAVTTVLYFDYRVRKEAFDLLLLAQQIGADPPAGATSALASVATQPSAPAADGSQPPFWPPPPGWSPSPPPSGEPPDGSPS